MVWANFLHIYQPPTQFPEMTKQITQESYEPLVAILENNPEAKMTLNINASLTEQLSVLGYGELLKRMAALAARGQLEFTGSAAYHALLPKLPLPEIKRQIELNKTINQHFFGDVYNPKGFFPPEMAYSSDVANALVELGYEWIILSEFAPPDNLSRESSHHAWKLANGNLALVFRDKGLSLDIAFNKVFSSSQFGDLIREHYGEDGGPITAIDGETFGHHNKGQEKILEALYRDQKSLKTLTISEYISQKPAEQSITPKDSSWGMEEADWHRGLPYPLWDDPQNPVHLLQWKLTALAMSAVDGQTRDLLDKALHSDQYWWASGRPYWRLDMIERGAALLRDVVMKAATSTQTQKDEAAMLFQQILYSAEHFKGRTIYDIPKL